DQDEHTSARDKSHAGAHCPAGEIETYISEDICIFSRLFSEE
uniref:Uncharacterized protein n=1 Tax=Chlorocebus sabaeus TaxID=60711 RepID=A0A0D9SAA2_CHLSB